MPSPARTGPCASRAAPVPRPPDLPWLSCSEREACRCTDLASLRAPSRQHLLPRPCPVIDDPNPRGPEGCRKASPRFCLGAANRPGPEGVTGSAGERCPSRLPSPQMLWGGGHIPPSSPTSRVPLAVGLKSQRGQTGGLAPGFSRPWVHIGPVGSRREPDVGPGAEGRWPVPRNCAAWTSHREGNLRVQT